MGKPRILIVEDERVVALDVEETLLSLNYAVAGVVASGEAALQSVEKSLPDLVLMDINLGEGIDGIETAARIQKLHDVPIVFLTAFADKPTLDRVKVLEPYGYVLKPFRQPELRTVIELALHKHSASRSRGDQVVDEQRPAIAAAAIPDFRKGIGPENLPGAAMQATIKNFLENTAPFSSLGSEFLTAMAAVCVVRSYEAQDSIVREGENPTSGFAVMNGRVAVFKTSAGGKELVVELLGSTDLFGVLTVLDRTPFPFSARAQGEVRLIWIPREVVFHLMETYPDVSRELFQNVIQRLRKAHDLSRALAHDRVEVRIASALLAMIGTFGEKSADGESALQFEMTRQELGELVGTTPETVSRVLNRLESDQIVDLSQAGKVRVVAQKELALLLES